MLRAAFALLVTVVLTILLGTPAVILSLFVPGSDVAMRLGRLWSRGILAAAGIHPSYEGLENATRSLPCIYLSNHQSFLDIWVLVAVLPVHTRFVAKRSLFWIPFFGWSLKTSGFIPIDRGSRRRAYESLDLAAGKIRMGRPVLLFPEGTRSRDGRLLPFKRGAFHLALQAGAPVVPVAISGTGRALRPGTVELRPGPVRVSFLPPIDVGPYRPDDAQGLLAAVREAIAHRLELEDAARPAAALEAGNL